MFDPCNFGLLRLSSKLYFPEAPVLQVKREVRKLLENKIRVNISNQSHFDFDVN